MRGLSVACAAAVALLAAAVASASPASVGYPTSIAATGDSITRAFDSAPPWLEQPQNSWSTGENLAVASHYARIAAGDAAIVGHAFNDARTGARMADLLGQATAAAAQQVDYLTVLVGANDACRSSEAVMTPVADYRAQFAAALAGFTAARPDARVYVVSIPDVYRLWELEHTNFVAVLTWEVASICRSLLANPLSTAPADMARRERVRDRVVAYNTQLADVCAQYVHCRFDGNAVFGTSFLASDVSALDYFHPSLSGQAKLSAVTWAAGFDFTDMSPPTSMAQLSPHRGGRSATVTLSAADNVGVSGIEYRIGRLPYGRYTVPVRLLRGRLLTYRAVDVNGNVEASRTLSLP